MYKSDVIPSEFNKIAEISDNYVVWVQESKLYNGDDYEAYYQFLKPSFYVVPVEDYRIKQGSEYYYESGDVEFYCYSMTPDYEYISGDVWQQADIVDYFPCQFIIVIAFLWVFKQLSRLFFKGGLF